MRLFPLVIVGAPLFWFCWVFCGLGAKFFPMVPSVTFLEIVGLTVCFYCVRAVLVPNSFDGKYTIIVEEPQPDWKW